MQPLNQASVGPVRSTATRLMPSSDCQEIRPAGLSVAARSGGNAAGYGYARPNHRHQRQPLTQAQFAGNPASSRIFSALSATSEV